ncbi:MAG: mechanosensitive ion channel family protein [Arcobacteraceae bacterium]
MKKIILFIGLVISLFAANEEIQRSGELLQSAISEEKRLKIETLKANIEVLDKQLNENILLKRYGNYIAYRQISQELHNLEEEYKAIIGKKGEKFDELEYQIGNKIRIKKNELELISEYKDSPIGNLINPPEIETNEPVTNPFGIINALSYIKKLETNKEKFKKLYNDIAALTALLEQKIVLNLELYEIEPSETTDIKIDFLAQQKKDFSIVLDIVSTTNNVYSRKIEQVILETQSQIGNQIEKSSKIIIAIVILFLISFLIKLILKRYFFQNENYYMVNKIINFIIVFIALMILIFSYIDNVSYIVTILGFASAGIAIALKDWFMSIFGWMVIVTSGSIHVGDRIKVQRNGIEVVGDVLDISLFKITIREDITLTTYVKNRRTGRIFFIPNNYIFSELIANYTHGDLRTVWDGIDITITFDSNYKKAQHLAKEILKQYSKGYTDITRKQLSKMRSKYSLRATGVEPRVYTFVEPYGIVISSWYLTNSYAALALRSTISPEILDAFMKEADIKIAYPTQSINLHTQKELPLELQETGIGKA